MHRYHCTQCHRTFRHYPQGIEPADQSLRLQQLAALCWQFGFRTRNVSGLFNAFGVALAHMTVWRDVQKRADWLCQKKPRPAMRVLGLDGVYGRVAGQPHTVTVAVNPGNGQLISLAEIDEHSVNQVVAWLKPWVEELGIEVLVTDDLAEYVQVAEQLGLQHQVCQFHLIRWVERALWELQAEIQSEWVWVIADPSMGAGVAGHRTGGPVCPVRTVACRAQSARRTGESSVSVAAIGLAVE